MPETIECRNPSCAATIRVAGRAIGDIVECPECRVQNMVIEQFAGNLDISATISSVQYAPGGRQVAHPARQRCSNCGALLGVRVSVCPGCGADIRTGEAILREVPEHAPPRRRAPAVVLLAVALLVVLVAVLVAVVLLAGGG